MPKPIYDGYTSYSYLTPVEDVEVWDLEDQLDRVPPYDLGLSEAEAARAQRLLDESVVISLHDHPQVFPRDTGQIRAYIRAGRQQTGYEGLAHSGLSAVFDNLMDGTGCITSKWGWKWDETLWDLGMRLADVAHQDYAAVVRGVDDILDAHRSGRLGVVFGLEAATPIENEVDRLDILYGFGIRQCGIAYSESNALGTGLKEARDGGLTAFGRRCVRRMNQLGMVIDVSHSSDRTCLDTCEASTKPVLITHAGARAVWDTPRMKPDDVLRACAETGGVLGVEAAPHTTLSVEHPHHSIESVMDHFQYCVELLGVDHVAFGPDTLYVDHVGFHHEYAAQLGMAAFRPKVPFEEVAYVAGMESPTENFANIVGWLVKHGWSDGDIQKVVGGNILRVLGQVW